MYDAVSEDMEFLGDAPNGDLAHAENDTRTEATEGLKQCLDALGRLLVLLWLLTAVGQAQIVLSVRAGLVHHLDGEVLVANQIVSDDPARFTRIAEGKTLRTEEGRAEILLGPGAILRVAPFSEVRLLSDDVSQSKGGGSGGFSNRCG